MPNTNYKINPSDDVKQVNGSAITGTSTVYKGGTAQYLGTSVPSGSVLTARVQHGHVFRAHGSVVYQSKWVFGAFRGSGATATGVADNGSGFCRFTDTSHGLTVGQVVDIRGATADAIEGPQRVTAVPTANTFDTDRAYTASATAGTYHLVAGRFASMTAGVYMMRGIGGASVANGQNGTILQSTGSDRGRRRSIHQLEAMRSRRVATAIRAGYWNIYTGTWSTDPTVADDMSTFETVGTDDAANPTRAKPGELVYRVSGQPNDTYGIFQDDYKAKTS